MEIKYEDIDDKFIWDYLKKIPEDKLYLAYLSTKGPHEYIEQKPDQKMAEGWLIWEELLQVIGRRLFSYADQDGFPKAKLFWKLKGFTPYSNLGDIAMYYLKKQIENSNNFKIENNARKN